MTKRKFGRLVLLVAAVSLLAGCATPITRNPVPEALVEKARVGNYHNIREWGDANPERRLLEARLAELDAYLKAARARGETPTLNVLTVSGGGSDGAFGAGFLTGWSKTGTRPEFVTVAGISTGALIAPFAFLGSDYDAAVSKIYTTISTRDVLSRQVLAGLTGGTALASSKPLQRLIAKYFDRSMMQAIVREHKKGRRLFVGTTNADAQRPVNWDIGAIATSGQPGALQLIHKILLASASVPGAFPPVLISVNINGRKYDELHVDGGVTSSIAFYPTTLEAGDWLKQLRPRTKATSYIIRNGKIAPAWEATKPRTLPNVGRAVSTMIKYQANADLVRLYLAARRDGIAYRLAHIPASFKVPEKEAFDRKYMNALYKVGYDLARKGYKWREAPPGLPTKAAK